MSSTVFLKEDIVKKRKLFIIITHIHRQSTTAVAYPGNNTLTLSCRENTTQRKSEAFFREWSE